MVQNILIGYHSYWGIRAILLQKEGSIWDIDTELQNELYTISNLESAKALIDYHQLFWLIEKRKTLTLKDGTAWRAYVNEYIDIGYLFDERLNSWQVWRPYNGIVKDIKTSEFKG